MVLDLSGDPTNQASGDKLRVRQTPMNLFKRMAFVSESLSWR